MINLLSFSEYVKFDSKLGIAYKDIFKMGEDGDNNLKSLDMFKNINGIYYFVSYDGIVLYIGESDEKRLKERIAQHFRDKDTGGLRHKFNDKNRSDLLNKLENSILYVFPLNENKGFVINLESILIKLYNPIMNGSV